MLRIVSRCIAATAMSMLGAGGAIAAVITVPGDAPTIQAGIEAAQNGDMVLVAAGTYTENIDFLGRAIKVIGESGAALTTLVPADPNAITILMDKGEGLGTEFAGFTVAGGIGPSVIQIEGGAEPLIHDNVFRGYDGEVQNAMVIETHYSNPTITHNLFLDNEGLAGVGIMDGTAQILNNTFDGNSRGFFTISDLGVARNNIVTNSTEYGVYGEFSMDYNCLWNNSPNYTSGAVPGPNYISADPLYCDPPTEDYTLDFASPCVASGESGIDRGAFEVGCGFTSPIVRNITVGDGDMQHILDHAPLISWWYDDPGEVPLASTAIEVGIDDDWTTAEMWQSAEIPGPDTATVYAGYPLADGATYYIRIRVSNGTTWGDWRVQSFRMNALPTVPIPASPVAGAAVHSSCTRLIADNSTDAEADVLTYDFEVYDDPGLTGLVFSQTEVTEQTLQTASDYLPTLPGGTTYWWQVRAYDGFETSDWSAPEFFVNLTSTLRRVPSEYATIQTGINAAQCGDTILVAAGTYVEHLNFLGKTVKVISESGAALTTLIPANPATTTILMDKGEGPETEFAGFTVSGGSGPSVVQVEGGAEPWIHHNVFRDYYSTEQNAIVIETHFSDPRITHNLFLDNVGSIGCVGIMEGTAQILNNTFDGNARGFWSITGLGVAKNNIVTNSIEFGIGDGFTQLDYNCVWNNHPDYDLDAVPGYNDITTDPLYCDTTYEDFSLDYLSPCIGTGEEGADRGAFGVGCNVPGSGPTVRAVVVGDGDPDHVVGETPLISWVYTDPDGIPIDESDVEVGTDDDWAVAEMWQALAIPGPDTSVTYDGAALVDGEDYYVRVRVFGNGIWSDWRVATFHMNTPPSVPVPDSPVGGTSIIPQCTKLVIDNSYDPESDPITHDFEVYDDAGLTRLTYSETDVPQVTPQTMSGFLSELPTGTYWWRVRASDGLEYSDWSATEWFQGIGPSVLRVPSEYLTIQAGIDAAQCGDTVLVAAGTYTENIDFQGKAIKVIGEFGAALTTLTPADPGAITILMDKGEGSEAEFAGFTVSGGAGPSVIQIEGGAEPVIHDNVFRDYYSTMSNAIVIEGHSSNPTIVRNLFLNNTGTIGCVGIMSGDGLILNNTFDGNMRGFWSQSSSVIARNNIVTNSLEFGIADGFDADYNCVYNNNPNYALGAVPGLNDIIGDPLYCNPSGEDYSLDYFSPCTGTGEGGENRGAFDVGCGAGPTVRNIAVGDGDMLHVIEHTPVIAWQYEDSDGKPLVSSEVEVGTDMDWTVAELWQSPTIPAPDTSVLYAGGALDDGTTYFVRVRTANDSTWGEWRAEPFHMNSLPAVPSHAYPVGGETTCLLSTRLVVNNSADAEADVLTYDFEVYDDPGLTTPVHSETGVAEQPVQTGTDYLPGLAAAMTYWWRARAHDSYEVSDWSGVETFVPTGPITRNVPTVYPSIQAAIDAACDGDTILVAAGTYTENIDYLGKAIHVLSGTGPELTSLIPADAEAISILMDKGEGPGTEFAGFNVSGGAGPSVIQIDGGAEPLIRNNVFRNYHSIMENAIVVETHNSNPTITHNLFVNNTGTIGCVGIISGTGQILHNTFDRNVRGFWSISGQGEAKNNIVTNSTESGISQTFTADYNCVWNNNPDYTWGAAPGPNDINVDPLYCDDFSGDYTLDFLSPCIGTGEGGSDRGALGVGCGAPGTGPIISFIAVGDGDGSRVVDHSPLIAWLYREPDSIPLAMSEVEVGTDNEWTVAEMWQSPPIPAPDTAVVYAGLVLSDGVDYHVRVRASNGTVWSAWKVMPFHMNVVPAIPVPVEPADGDVVSITYPRLRITNLSDSEGDALSCDFEVYLEEEPETPVATVSGVAQLGAEASWIVDPPLTSENSSYWWRARAFDGAEYGLWSSMQMFILNAVNDPPEPAVLLAPDDAAAVFDLTPYYDWEDAVDPDPDAVEEITYTFTVATDSLFLFKIEYPDLPFSFFQSPMMPFGQRYWWRVAATDDDGETSLSATRSLYIPGPGDLNGDGTYDALDVVLLVNVVFRSDPMPPDIYIVDVNGDCKVDVLDVVTLVNHVFRGGPVPTALCGAATADRSLHVPLEYQTIQLAINAASDGDTVAVAPGTYWENLDYQGKAIHVIGEGGATATILFPADELQTTITMTAGEGAGTEFAGFTVIGGTGPSVIQIENGAAPIIRNNVFRNYHSTLQNAIVVESYESNPTIAFNLFIENTGTIGCVGIFTGGGSIINNTFDQNMRGFWSQSPTVIARNNIVTNSTEFGILDVFNSDYNCVYNNNSDYGAGASPAPHDISANPSYCDPTAEDYHLQPGSACEGTGEGGATMGAFDIGCPPP